MTPPIASARAGLVSQVGDAIPDSVVDNFEAKSASPAGPYASGETVTDYYSRDTGNFSRTATNAIEGSNALQLDSNTSPGWIWSSPADGLPRYFSEGDTARFLIRSTTDMEAPAFFFGSPDGTNGYSAVLNNIDGQLEIRRFDSGSVTTIKTKSSPAISNGTWYWGEERIPASDDQTNSVSPNITFDLYDVDTSSGVGRGSPIESVSVVDYNHSGRYHGVVNHSGSSPSTTSTILDGIEVK